MTQAIAILVAIALWLYAASQLRKWNSWSRFNPEAAKTVFSGRSRGSALAVVLFSDPPERHSDMWK